MVKGPQVVNMKQKQLQTSRELHIQPLSIKRRTHFTVILSQHHPPDAGGERVSKRPLLRIQTCSTYNKKPRWDSRSGGAEPNLLNIAFPYFFTWNSEDFRSEPQIWSSLFHNKHPESISLIFDSCRASSFLFIYIFLSLFLSHCWSLSSSTSVTLKRSSEFSRESAEFSRQKRDGKFLSYAFGNLSELVLRSSLLYGTFVFCFWSE